MYDDNSKQNITCSEHNELSEYQLDNIIQLQF